MVADPLFFLKIDHLKATDFTTTVPIRPMVGATVGRLWPSQRDLPRDFVRYATAGRFLYDPTRPSHRDMPTVAQTLRVLPTFANGLESKS
jgi:hypothetical protein